MPYPITTSMKQEAVKLTPDQIIESFIVDLASIEGYVAFVSSTKKIVSRNRNGMFPTTRILVGDYITIEGSSNNDGTYTVASVSSGEIVVSESLMDESTVSVRITNYLYFVKNIFSIVGWKMEDGVLVNTEQSYTAINIGRENIQFELESPGKGNIIRINVGNVDRVIESLIQNRAYLRGCFIFVVTMYAKHFPSGVGDTYIGSSPDYLSNVCEKFIIDSTSSSEKAVTFDCKFKFSLKDFNLPSRLLDRNFCAWATRYKGVECDPTDSINESLWPTCNGTLNDCRQRGNSKRFGGFPSIPKTSIYL